MIMTKAFLVFTVMGAALLSGCQTASVSAERVPAKLSGEADMVVLKAMLSDVLGRKPIEFGTGNPLEGAEFSVLPSRRDAEVRRVVLPDTFVLLKKGKLCMLEHTQKEIFMPLDSINCEPI